MTRRIIHIVATNAFAGTERYVATLARAQAERDCQVAVIGGLPGPMRALLGSRVDHQEYSGPIGAIRRLRSMDRADVVHAHLTTAELLSCVAFPFRRDLKIVSTRHIAAPRGSSLGGRFAAHLIRRRIDGQIAPSLYLAGRIDGHSEVILTGVQDAPAGVHDEPVVLVAQRLEAEKDTTTALRAWAASGLASAGWRLVVAGTGKEDAMLRQLASELGISGTCTFVGQVDDITERMGRSSIVLCTATSDSFGLTAVEAMACGAAVVASAAGGHLETIGAVDQSVLYEVRNPSSAAQRLIHLASDSTLRVEYGRRLRLHQQKELAIDSFAERVLAFYEKVESRPNSSHSGAPRE